jgi:hypothetical protein
VGPPPVPDRPGAARSRGAAPGRAAASHSEGLLRRAHPSGRSPGESRDRALLVFVDHRGARGAAGRVGLVRTPSADPPGDRSAAGRFEPRRSLPPGPLRTPGIHRSTPGSDDPGVRTAHRRVLRFEVDGGLLRDPGVGDFRGPRQPRRLVDGRRVVWGVSRHRLAGDALLPSPGTPAGSQSRSRRAAAQRDCRRADPLRKGHPRHTGAGVHRYHDAVECRGSTPGGRPRAGPRSPGKSPATCAAESGRGAALGWRPAARAAGPWRPALRHPTTGPTDHVGLQHRAPRASGGPALCAVRRARAAPAAHRPGGLDQRRPTQRSRPSTYACATSRAR